MKRLDDLLSWVSDEAFKLLRQNNKMNLNLMEYLHLFIYLRIKWLLLKSTIWDGHVSVWIEKMQQ